MTHSVVQDYPEGWSVISLMAPLLPLTLSRIRVSPQQEQTPSEAGFGIIHWFFINICEHTDFQLILEARLEPMTVTPSRLLHISTKKYKHPIGTCALVSLFFPPGSLCKLTKLETWGQNDFPSHRGPGRA
jgi:hypothetical protein